jgi:hypothetical protein
MMTLWVGSELCILTVLVVAFEEQAIWLGGSAGASAQGVKWVAEACWGLSSF